MGNKRKIFVLDTNVLVHDPTAILRFQEHDVYIPIVVLEELDHAKVGMSEIARNVRQASRLLDELVEKANGDISRGVKLPSVTTDIETGRLYFHLEAVHSHLPNGMSTSNPDNILLGITLDLGKSHPRPSGGAGIEGHQPAHQGARPRVFTPRTIPTTRCWTTPTCCTPARSGSIPTSGRHTARTWNRGRRKAGPSTASRGPKARSWFPGQFIYTEDAHPFEAVVRRIEANTAIIEVVKDYASERHKVWGIHARNREQNFALNLLMDPGVDFVSLLGHAGTGKTLLTLAAALAQTLEQRRYSEIIMTRQTVPVGEDIGFLPGTEEEKMGPWMGALEDNLDVLQEQATQEHGAWGRAATHDLLKSRIRIKSLNFMRGRTFLKKFLIIDEAQNLSPHQIKTLVTRAGPGSKIVCLGNIAQIDTPYLTETTSGLTYIVDRFKLWEHSGHVTLQRGERSRLADYASEIL